MSKLLDAMRAIMRADAERLAPRILARQIEELRAAPDGAARVNVQPVRGSLPDVPVERFRYVHRNATAKQEEHGYVEPVNGPVPTAEWIEQNRGIASKGLPPAPKRKYKAPREKGQLGISPERRARTHVPMWLRIMMTPYGEIPCQYGPNAWQPTPEAARRIARFPAR